MTTGGKYHTAVARLQPQAYFTLDVPFYFRAGNHEFSILNTFTKYYNCWTTRFAQPATDYGYFENDVFFFTGGKEINYEVETMPQEIMQSNFFTGTPFYASNTVKYQYTSSKILFSIAWQSYMMGGISTLGNGPLHNNIGVYSETSANPNIAKATTNPNERYKQVGRLNQDKAYVLRMMLSYRPTNFLSFAITGKFRDGQPFANYDTQFATDPNGNTQLAVWNHNSKGINPLDGDFGCREDAFFNFDFMTQFTGKAWNHAYELQAMVYNFYDFGTELAEYTFLKSADGDVERRSMEICIPRGLMVTGKIYF
jgi:hypothetical protein